MIEAIGVVVPAHNERDQIAGCIQAIERAREEVGAEIDTCLVLVLDACSDQTLAEVQRVVRPPYALVEVDYQNVGRTRGAGIARVFEQFSLLTPDKIWLASTDADSRVPRTWLRDQIELARCGIDAVAGTVRVDDWTGYSQQFIDAFVEFYERHGDADEHWHVHGANLGMRGSVYRAVGGFGHLVTGEDQAIWRALRRSGRRTLATRALQVLTSGRRVARAPLGFSSFLQSFRPDAA